MQIKKSDLKSFVCLGVSTGLVLGYGLNYIRVLRTERAKRKKIDEFERSYMGAAENGQKRLMKLREAEPFDQKAFWDAWNEETKFMHILRNQPMY